MYGNQHYVAGQLFSKHGFGFIRVERNFADKHSWHNQKKRTYVEISMNQEKQYN